MRFLADSSNGMPFLLDIDDFKMLTTTGTCPSVIRCCVTYTNLERNCSSDLGRIGGDEFAVLMCDITSMENATVKAGQIAVWQRRGKRRTGRYPAIIGMVFCRSDDGAAFDDLYQKADSTLYKPRERQNVLSYLMKICSENSRGIFWKNVKATASHLNNGEAAFDLK